MKRFRWLPHIGWVDLSIEEAAGLGLEQVCRWQWQLFQISWLNVGIGLFVRAKARL